MAIALSAMLMAALVGVLRGVSYQVRAAERMDFDEWPSRFVDLLHRDLLAAEALSANDGFTWIEGELPAYGDDPEVSGLRVIGYGCVPAGQDSVLARLDGQLRGLIAIGPRRLVIERLDDSGMPQPLPPRPGPVPRRVRIWIWAEVDSEPLMVRDLVLF